MKTNLASSIPEPTELEIQHAAYLLWMESGRAPDHDLDNWLAAKELLRHRHGRALSDKRQRAGVGEPVPALSRSRTHPCSSN